MCVSLKLERSVRISQFVYWYFMTIVRLNVALVFQWKSVYISTYLFPWWNLQPVYWSSTRFLSIKVNLAVACWISHYIVMCTTRVVYRYSKIIICSRIIVSICRKSDVETIISEMCVIIAIRDLCGSMKSTVNHLKWLYLLLDVCMYYMYLFAYKTNICMKM